MDILNVKKLESIFKIGAGTVKPCPLPDVDLDGHRAIEHVSLIRIKPQPAGWNYDAEEISADNKRFKKFLIESGLNDKQIEDLLKKLGN